MNASLRFAGDGASVRLLGIILRVAPGVVLRGVTGVVGVVLRGTSIGFAVLFVVFVVRFVVVAVVFGRISDCLRNQFG